MVEELYEKYHSELVRWCQMMTGDLQTAEELVQEAFLRAMLRKEQLTQLEERQARAWLYRTIKNLYVDRVRHTSRETMAEELPEKAALPEEMTRIEWENLLAALPDMEGAMFAMRYLYGYNSKQLGEIFDLPSGTVRSKLSSARKHLRELLGGR